MPLRNSLHRRNHKERSQLAHRARLGILEKHKDYVKRARDYHSKQDRLNRLKQKVAEKNKDEFYFSMKRQSTKGGVHLADRGNVALPVDIVKVLKSQDENYVRTMRTAGLKKIDKIKAQLTAMADLLRPASLEDGAEVEELEPEELETLQNAGIIPRPKGKGRASKHVVFVQDEEEAKEYVSTSRNRNATLGQSTSTSSNSAQTDLGWKVPTKMSRRSALEEDEGVEEAAGEIIAEERREASRSNRTRLLKELSARLFRDTQLRYAEREFEMQRQLMGKGARRKIAGVEAVEESNDAEENEDEIDARRGKRRAPSQKFADAKTYKPRVYKFRLERRGK
ncbi:u3 small nucleolar RNA-associated protein 11 [Mycena amicta]|nr:u3 small nucleolar RNA-associated protein 11 [Mycena amicta]